MEFAHFLACFGLYIAYIEDMTEQFPLELVSVSTGAFCEKYGYSRVEVTSAFKTLYASM